MTQPLVIAGGGTGGHVFVARAIAEALERAGVERNDLRFIGSSRGQERELLADTGVTLTLLPGRGIRRSIAPRALLANVGALVGIVTATAEALWCCARWWPRAVVSVGGYAAAPVGLAAVLLRRPLVLVNIDAVPGLTHRLLGRFAAASCVAVGGSSLRGEVVTGIPVRDEFAALDRSPGARRSARLQLGTEPDLPLVAVVTGSLGARTVNNAVVELATTSTSLSATIFHVTGRRDATDIEAARPKPRSEGPVYITVPFENRMALLYQAADVAVTRAGALTIGELASAAVAGILVPLPGAPGDHQTKNAAALVDRGAAILVPDDELDAARLEAELLALLEDPARLVAMEQSARALSHPHAAAEVAEEVLRHAR